MKGRLGLQYIILGRNLLALMLAWQLNSFGQSPASTRPFVFQIDSLKRELYLQHSHSVKANLLLQISTIYVHINADSCIVYTEQAISYYRSTNNYAFQTFLAGRLGYAYIMKGNLPKALDLNLNALDFAEAMNLGNESIGPVIDNIGLIYYYLGDHQSALKYFRRMTELGDEDILGVAFGYYGMATVYEKQNQLDSALTCLKYSFDQFTKATQTSKPNLTTDTKYWYEVYPAWYNLRAKVYLKQNKPELALADLRASLKITAMSNEILLAIDTYNDVSALYKARDHQDSSIFYAEKAVNEASKNSYTRGILNASVILADLYEPKDPAKALHYFRLASETEKKLYGAGNVQVMRDMIAQNEKKKQELALAESTFKDRLRMNALVGSIFTLVVIVFLQYRNNRQKQKSNLRLGAAYDQLKSTQSQLIQSEKMASLGDLTAGIAHEIQNPLNFVNNFSEVNSELIDELKSELSAGNQHSAEEIANSIKANQEKINAHGKRADSIVKSMMQHSRIGSGQKESTDINQLTDEYLRMAYHGFRAKDKYFNANFQTDFDASGPKINVVPQDIGRVILNLINNAFYVVNEKSKKVSGYEPKIVVSTKRLDDKIEISVKDNGNGIPDAIKEKIFQPFFTTKPTGQGTGLGLSLSYDIVKAHGGELKVETKEGDGSEFIIQLRSN